MDSSVPNALGSPLSSLLSSTKSTNAMPSGSRDFGVTACADVVGIVCEVGVGKAYGAALEPVHLDEADLGPVIERLHLVGVTLREPIAATGSSDKDDKDQ